MCGGPHNKDHSIFESLWGSPILGNYPKPQTLNPSQSPAAEAVKVLSRPAFACRGIEGQICLWLRQLGLYLSWSQRSLKGVIYGIIIGVIFGDTRSLGFRVWGLNSLKGVIYGSIIGVIFGDTRSLGFRVWGLNSLKGVIYGTIIGDIFGDTRSLGFRVLGSKLLKGGYIREYYRGYIWRY